jgi:NADP-dependent 3-hydroxy acid dehydrogenase YdfG/acyl carrier protein
VQAVTLTAPTIPVISNLTGEPAGSEELCTPRYWVRQLREPVRFRDGVDWLASNGVGSYLELGPDGRLSALCSECLNGSADGSFTIVPALRGQDRDGAESLLSALARLWVNGVDVDWPKLYEASGARRLEFPTYPFQRRRYWAEQSSNLEDPRDHDRSNEHPLLDNGAELASGMGWLFSGRVSPQRLRWLSDHVVQGQRIMPAALYVELALHVCSVLGCARLDELVQEAVLVLPDEDTIELQVVAGAGEEGRYKLEIYARVQPGSGAGAAWARYASGTLGASRAGRDTVAQAVEGAAKDGWPPAAREVSPYDLYDLLYRRGFEYGQSFRTVGRAWESPECVFSEALLHGSEWEQSGRYRLHPLLLDGALHGHCLGLADHLTHDDGAVMLPFAWSGVELHSTGASRLRIQLTRAGQGKLTFVITDGAGALVATVDSLTLQPVPPSQIGDPDGSSQGLVHRVAWTAVRGSGGRGHAPDQVVLVGDDGEISAVLREQHVAVQCYEDLLQVDAAVDRGGRLPETVLAGFPRSDGNADLPRQVHGAVNQALSLAQQWIGDERFGAGRLVYLTRGCISITEEEAPDLSTAGVWGLANAVAAENPRRVALVDMDGDPASWRALGDALATEEVAVAVRAGQVLVPRLRRLNPPATTSRLDIAGTALITGGTGALGGVIAEHLVDKHRLRDLMLVSRQGPQAPGASALAARLRALGANVTLAACDVSEPRQLCRLLSAIPAARPLQMIVHCAGERDDGIAMTMTQERVDRALSAKVDGAWHLHELTAGLSLQAFVVFSSAASLIGNVGQAGYAAANLFLEALVAHRRANGLVGQSIAWGLWHELGFARHLREIDVARLERAGIGAFPVDRGLAMFDVACSHDVAHVVALQPSPQRLRAGAALPALLRDLSQPRLDDASAHERARWLTTLPPDALRTALLDVVCDSAAEILARAVSVDELGDRSFKEIGFDSLAAVELRNRLTAVTGLHLPATLLFDYATPAALAEHLAARVSPMPPGEHDREQRIHDAIASIPIHRLRQAGVLEVLMDLVRESDDQTLISAPATDEMDIESLVSATLAEGGGQWAEA